MQQNGDFKSLIYVGKDKGGRATRDRIKQKKKQSSVTEEKMNGTETDKLLVLISGGDNAAFEELYLRTKRGVFAFLYTYLHDVADTEDAMQTVYLKIKTSIASYRRGTNGRAWILQIAKNHALNVLRQKKRAVSLDDAPEIAVRPEEDHGVTELMQRLLSEDEQRIVTLHVLWDYKHREIAEMLSLPTGTVTSKYKRAIEKLRNALKEVEQ